MDSKKKRAKPLLREGGRENTPVEQSKVKKKDKTKQSRGNVSYVNVYNTKRRGVRLSVHARAALQSMSRELKHGDYGVVGDSSADVVADPLENFAQTDGEKRSDKTEFEIKGGLVVDDASYSACTGHGMSFGWKIPALVKNTGAGKNYVDFRGQFNTIECALITVTNELEDTIVIEGSSPRCQLLYPTLVTARNDNVKEFLEPGKAKTIKVSYGPTQGFFVPEIITTGVKMPELVFYEMLVKRPKISVAANTAISADRVVARVAIEIIYTTATLVALQNTVVYEQRTDFDTIGFKTTPMRDIFKFDPWFLPAAGIAGFQTTPIPGPVDVGEKGFSLELKNGWVALRAQVELFTYAGRARLVPPPGTLEGDFRWDQKDEQWYWTVAGVKVKAAVERGKVYAVGQPFTALLLRESNVRYGGGLETFIKVATTVLELLALFA